MSALPVLSYLFSVTVVTDGKQCPLPVSSVRSSWAFLCTWRAVKSASDPSAHTYKHTSNRARVKVVGLCCSAKLSQSLGQPKRPHASQGCAARTKPSSQLSTEAALAVYKRKLRCERRGDGARDLALECLPARAACPVKAKAHIPTGHR